ncbi:hypothetical protein RZS08_41935, partial [Arthrospira platensis SPKY1]|nr:hypothetical protein [Arthrospira platensis SPKY1]
VVLTRRESDVPRRPDAGSNVRRRHRRHQVRPVVSGRVHRRAHRPDPQPFGRTRDQQRLEHRRIGQFRIEPAGFGGRVQDRRHPVVNRGDPGVRRGHQDRAGL